MGWDGKWEQCKYRQQRELQDSEVQEPFQKEDEWYTSEESPSTETQYCTAESHTIEEEEEELCDNNEDKWSLQQQQDELVEMMEQTEEDREVCMNELEMLRNHCTALEDERSQLLNKVGTVTLSHRQLGST